MSIIAARNYKIRDTDLYCGIDRQIPTVLSYVDGDEYYGNQAKNFLVRNPDNTIAFFRDFLGQE